MSKKHRQGNQNQSGTLTTLPHATEYHIIKHDLIKVVVLNTIYLIGVLAIYYSNLKIGYLENWFNKIFHI